MFDPKILIIRYKVGRLAKKLVNRSSSLSDDDFSKLTAIDALEGTFGITLTESQIVCSLMILNGVFAQMATGEGKTFSIGLAAAWMSSEGNRVHVVAPNEYLSNRDCEQLEPFFKRLNLNVCCITSSIHEEDRLSFYGNDIVYTTPSIIAFDHMRERSRIGANHQYQYIPEKSHLIIDEADAVLIENGSIPFIFARNIDSDKEFWIKSVEWIESISESCFEYDLQTESTYLSAEGYQAFEQFMIEFGFVSRSHEVYSSKKSGYFHKITIVVRAIKDFSENSDYLVTDESIVILNQSTGRAEKDRQWGQGLHQAIEAKHGLEISDESEIISKITMPELVSLYDNFSGTSATILHAEEEIFQRYGRLTLSVPRANPDNRAFFEDLCFDSKQLKYDVIVRDAKNILDSGQPVLLGVESISEANDLYEMFVSKNIEPKLLTAINESKEAYIIAEAGLPGSLTIATNMAGRGTDIKLGGSDESLKEETLNAGGLHVIGASRQSERRLDDQLSGRCGRQGDPGSTRFYLSLGDKLFNDQDKITSIRKITKKSLLLLQQSKANKISVSRDEIDSYNEVFLIHRDIYYEIRDYWFQIEPAAVFDELLNLFIVKIRKEMVDYGVHKSGFYKDFDGFVDEARSLMQDSSISFSDLNKKLSGIELCSGIEKKLISDICYTLTDEKLAAITESAYQLFEDMWSNHQILLEQIYDHAKWQSLIQKNERIQFAFFGYDAMDDFLTQLENNLLKLLFEGIK